MSQVAQRRAKHELGDEDSNLGIWIQSPLYYHYTIPQEQELLYHGLTVMQAPHEGGIRSKSPQWGNLPESLELSGR
jgi:hypothetical protein